MKHRTRITLLVTLILCLMTTALISAQDEDPVPDFITLDDGEVFFGELDVNNILHAQLFTFGASEGDTVTIDLKTSDEELLDPFLLVFGPSGQLVSADDDSGGAPNASINNFDIPEDGNYYVVATSYNTIYEIFTLGADLVAATQESELVVIFELSVEGNTNPNSDHQFTVVEGGDTVTFEISEEITVGYMVFAAEEGDMVNLLAASDDVDTLLYLFDTNGHLVMVNDDVGGEADTTNSRITDYEVPTSGVYLVFVTVVGYDSTLLDDPMFDPGEIEFTIE
jgi:hypothetical protein